MKRRAPKAALAAAAILAPFFFPWPLAALAAFALALMEPAAGLALGVILDALYFAHGAAHLPACTLFGLAGTVLAFLVRRFVKTRIMSG
jgi:hypothetical protein